MSERDEYAARPRHEAPPPPLDWRESTTPGLQPAGGPPFSGAGASPVGAGGTVGNDSPGYAGYGGGDTPGYAGRGDLDHTSASRDHTAPQYSTTPVTVRRPDVLAGLLLLLAGIAAGVSLLLDWASGSQGWDLVTDGLEGFDAGSWQPPVIVLAGGVLLVLGLLMFLPARGHKTLGVLALLATMAAAGGVLVLLNATQFTWDFFDAGFWCAAAVPVLGLLGSLKAMLTGPKQR